MVTLKVILISICCFVKFDCHPALIDFSNVPEEACKNWSAKDIEWLKSGRYQKNRDKAWICSLSKIYDSMLMWAYYVNQR